MSDFVTWLGRAVELMEWMLAKVDVGAGLVSVVVAVLDVDVAVLP